MLSQSADVTLCPVSQCPLFTPFLPVCCVSLVRVKNGWSDKLIKASLHACMDRRRRREAQAMIYTPVKAGQPPAGLEFLYSGSAVASGRRSTPEPHLRSAIKKDTGCSGGRYFTFSPVGKPEAPFHTLCTHNTLTHTCTECAKIIKLSKDFSAGPLN